MEKTIWRLALCILLHLAPHLSGAAVDLCAPSCSAEGIDRLPHPQFCNQFYQCSSGAPYLEHCPEDLVFSPTAKVCTHPEQAGCTSDSNRDCRGKSRATCTPSCPWSNAYMPHPQDCSKFYICGDLVPYEMNCQPGLQYSSQLMRCDYPEMANCIANPEFACDELLL